MKKLYLSLLLSVFLIGCFLTPSFASEISVKSIDYWTEIFPVYCVLGSKILEEGDGLFIWTIKNNSNKEQIIKVSSEVVDYSTPSCQTVTLSPGEEKSIGQFPVFNDKILDIAEQKVASARFTLQKGSDVIYEETKEITILATDDMLWGIDDGFDTSYLIAAWVTPRDPAIREIVTEAKEKVPDRSFCGYQRGTEEELLQEMDAIWQTVQEMGISYVSSSTSFATGQTQKVRLPAESIKEKSANCVDGTVLLASIFENIEMEPLIVITSDHAYLGIRSASGSEEAYYIETTMLGNSTFQEALDAGYENFNELSKLQEGKDYVIIDVSQLRLEGITPIPVKSKSK